MHFIRSRIMRIVAVIWYKATPMSITHWQSDMHHRDSIRVTRAGSPPPWPLSYQNQVKSGVQSLDYMALSTQPDISDSCDAFTHHNTIACDVKAWWACYYWDRPGSGLDPPGHRWWLPHQTIFLLVQPGDLYSRCTAHSTALSPNF